jgi:hypothetical protein
VSHRLPESLDQARHFDRKVVRYLTAGICRTCSAQAAWGHQLGFSLIQPPCADCRDAVAALPTPSVGGWRKLTRNRASGAENAQPAPWQSSLAATPTRSLTGAGRVA